jgi:hypothetical protein
MRSAWDSSCNIEKTMKSEMQIDRKQSHDERCIADYRFKTGSADGIF